MEAVPVLLLDFIVEYALSEITEHMMKSACGWSKRKWKKIMKRINDHKKHRPKEIMRRISKLPSEAQINIMDYVVKIGREIDKIPIQQESEI